MKIIVNIVKGQGKKYSCTFLKIHYLPNVVVLKNTHKLLHWVKNAHKFSY